VYVLVFEAVFYFVFQHGAKYIYDTDDDNFLKYALSGFEASREWTNHLVLVTDNQTNNPYVHFGQSTLWPRGYPLDRVGLDADRRYRLCNISPSAVQQGMVDGDPDVDAIFRLTRRQKSSPLHLTFDRTAPPFVLPRRTFAPFNSQNTFFAATAFWGLLLPGNSASDRVVDIYRSYWVQRLLWLLGDGVTFAPPMSLQVRNPHSDLSDANEESVLYRDVGRYISVLSRWECGEDAQFMFDCISRLSRHLVSEGFWTSRDADMVDAWLSDLSSIGYVPPPLSAAAGSGIAACRSDKSEHRRMVFYPVEQNTSLPHSQSLHVPADTTNLELVIKHVSSSCGPLHGKYWSSAMRNARKYPDILLVISVPGNIHSSLPSLEATYRPHFPNILYCVRHRISDTFIDRWRVSVVWVDEDPALLPCVLAAGEIHYNVHGVFHITSNMFVNLEQGRIANFVDSLVWMSGEFHAYSSSTLSQCHRKSITCRHMSRDVLSRFNGVIEDSTLLSIERKSKLRTCVTKLEGDPTWVSQKDVLWISDFAMYVPTRLIPQLAELRTALSPSHNPQHDLLVHLMFECDQLTVNYLHHSIDVKALTDPSNVDYVLPFSFDKINSVVDATKQFCSYIEQFKSS